MIETYITPGLVVGIGLSSGDKWNEDLIDFTKTSER